MHHHPLSLTGLDRLRFERHVTSLHQKPARVTAGFLEDLATRIGQAQLLGYPAEFWLNLQSQYDLAVLRREKGPEIESQVVAA